MILNEICIKGKTMSKAIEIIKNFIAEPEKYWEKNERQIKKFINRRADILMHYGWNNDDFANHAQSVVKKRIENSITSIYLPSFGSSGSHLLQQILNLSYEIIPLGEVYVPPKLTKIVRNFSHEEQFFFIELYSIIHCQNPERFLKLLPLVNTAHTPILLPFGEFSKAFRAMLILRNPVNIVLSRTFRKNEYKEHLGLTDRPEMEYLSENIMKTLKFYKQADAYNFQFKIKYEDVVNEELMTNVAQNIEGFMEGVKVKSPLITSLRAAVFGGEKTNKYVGDKVNIPEEYRGIVQKELKSILPLFDYPELPVIGF